MNSAVKEGEVVVAKVGFVLLNRFHRRSVAHVVIATDANQRDVLVKTTKASHKVFNLFLFDVGVLLGPSIGQVSADNEEGRLRVHLVDAVDGLVTKLDFSFPRDIRILVIDRSIAVVDDEAELRISSLKIETF